jgi:two-component system, OmpR family, phosphate regulon response regulator OmpR
MNKLKAADTEPDKKPHILVVDDDERLRELLSRFLIEHGFLVTTAVDAGEAREILKYLAYDLMIFDVMMPGEDGMALTKALKKQGMTTPVLLLTALGEIESRISGFEAGADDYLAKPFEPRELLLRINAILRRVAAKPPEKDAPVRFGKCLLDLDRGELAAGEERVALTSVEHTLLKALASKKGEVVSREELAALCQMSANERTIDVQITRLRKKVEQDPKLPRYVQTVRGKGYVLWSD